MPRNLGLTLGTVIFVAAVGLTGCTHDTAKKLDSTETSVPIAASSAATVVPTTPLPPLPPPEALTEVLSRLADPAVPGADKLNLVEGATPDTAAALDRFTTAARDSGYLPMTFTANNVAWSGKDPTDVAATVVVNTARPDHREFTFPMVFNSFQGGWQLSRNTAEVLLAMGNARTSSSTTPPTPLPVPSPPTSPAPGPGPEPAPSPSGSTAPPPIPSDNPAPTPTS